MMDAAHAQYLIEKVEVYVFLPIQIRISTTNRACFPQSYQEQNLERVSDPPFQ